MRRNKQSCFVAYSFCHGDQSDNISHFLGKTDVLDGNIFDTLHMGDAFIRNVFIKSDTCKNCDLSRGIKSCKVGMRVCLGIAQFLSCFEDLAQSLIPMDPSNVVFTSDMETVKVQKEHKITSLKVNGNDMRGYTLAVDLSRDGTWLLWQ